MLPLPEGNTYLGFLFAYGETAVGVEDRPRRAHDALKFEITEMLPVVGLLISVFWSGPVRQFNLAHPRERTGTLIRAQPEAEELVGLERQSGVVRTDPSRIRVHRSDHGAFNQVLEFPHIAGPIVCSECIHCCLWYLLNPVWSENWIGLFAVSYR